MRFNARFAPKMLTKQFDQIDPPLVAKSGQLPIFHHSQPSKNFELQTFALRPRSPFIHLNIQHRAIAPVWRKLGYLLRWPDLVVVIIDHLARCASVADAQYSSFLDKTGAQFVHFCLQRRLPPHLAPQPGRSSPLVTRAYEARLKMALKNG